MSAIASLPPGLRTPCRLGEDAALGGRKVDDPVGEHCVEARVVERELLDVSLHEFHLREPLAVPKVRSLGELLVGDIHPHDAT
jgi:hypothetical protein